MKFQRLPTIKAEFKSLKNEDEFSKSEIREEKNESQNSETIQLERKEWHPGILPGDI